MLAYERMLYMVEKYTAKLWTKYTNIADIRTELDKFMEQFEK